MSSTVDPFTEEILRGCLLATSREMFSATVRSAYSTTFSEGEDFTCALFDVTGAMVAQANGLPGQPGALVDAMRVILDRFGTLGEGDVVVLNDPYRGGSHQADVVICRSIYVDGEHVGYGMNAGHWIDIGGMAPGGWSGIATEVIQEALIIPPVRLYRNNELMLEIQDFILSNVRMRDQVWGDLLAQVASCVVAERRLRELAGQYGMDLLRAGMAAAIRYSSRRFRHHLASVPNGTYRATEILEDDGQGHGPFIIRVEVRKDDDGIVVDYTGTDPQFAGPVNLGFAFTRAAATCAIIAIVDPEVPVNQGVIDLVEVMAPLGTLVNPVYPAPVFCGSSDPRTRAAEVVVRALSKACPDRVAAGSYGTGNDVAGSGVDPQTGEEFLWYIFESGGCGARSQQDGNSADWHMIGNCRNESMELWESRFPVRFDSYELVQDSGGPGRLRGGLGVRRSMRMLADTSITGYADRHVVPPWGVDGGADGTPNRFSVERDGHAQGLQEAFGTSSPSKFYKLQLHTDDVLVIQQGGGGGFGPVGGRPIDMIERDLQEGYISVEAARDVYGARIDADGRLSRKALP